MPFSDQKIDSSARQSCSCKIVLFFRDKVPRQTSRISKSTKRNCPLVFAGLCRSLPVFAVVPLG
ncbi:MAG TPA: hypothetical protein DEB39_15000 [Planctomycetaceae bacterium]|nr:hypothetical protein [Planctomycetaceae bacterium]